MKSDRHLQAAFDLSDQEFKAYLSTLSGEQRLDAERARRLKAGLRELKRVPECQLTTDHLRRAVLERAMMRPARASRAWSWTLAPIAALAAWAVAVRNGPVPDRPKAPPPYIAARTPMAAPVALAESAVGPVLEPDAPDPTREGFRPAPPRPGEGRVPTRTVPPDRPKTRAGERLASPVAQTNRPAMARSGRHAAQLIAEPTQEGGDREPAEGPVVVVVTETPDPTTGGQQAVEVSRHEDVVFGG